MRFMVMFLLVFSRNYELLNCSGDFVNDCKHSERYFDKNVQPTTYNFTVNFLNPEGGVITFWNSTGLWHVSMSDCMIYDCEM